MAYWGNAELDERGHRLAIAYFVIAIITGPMFAAGATSTLALKAHGVSVSLVSLTIGLLANPLWPLLTDLKFVGPLVSQMLGGLGGLMLSAAAKAKTND